MWANDKWKGSLYRDDCRSTEFLAHYSRYFNAVEGNTTFYADPNADTVAKWQRDVTGDFGFMFKVPKRISHALSNSATDTLQAWLHLLAPLTPHIHCIQLQLPAQFTPSQLPLLTPLLQDIRQQFRCVVEVRHSEFFQKGAAEQALHQLLRQYHCERLCFDARALFSVPASTPALVDAQQKKPRLPVHAVALTERPVVRFIGLDDLAANRPFYQPWLGKFTTWIQAGHRPAIYFHTPDNRLAPQLARQFARDLHTASQISHPCLSPWPLDMTPQQAPLF